ncbi:general transcription factor IIF subunit 2-like [Brachionichthys hirsutus]|uniref:general transcription factor IIF subunit 2-like n=1 Tax=Brachionichthys hirsutus TaxID=412623 RepID=UPI0036047AAA
MADKAQVDLSGVKQSQGVWLVKVPKYLSRQWEKASEKGEVGKISIIKKHGKSEVHFSLREELTALGPVGESDAPLQVPKDHCFTMHTVAERTMAVFSQSEEDEISLEGTVVHRAECRPDASENYMKLKKRNESIKPPRLAQQLDRAVTTIFKPVANHDFNVVQHKKKKLEGKMVRAERQVVLDMLFSAFEKHQYYNIKNLVEITKQPVMYLKEILKEVGTYNNKGAHKNTWELKPEYRHYQPAEEEQT